MQFVHLANATELQERENVLNGLTEVVEDDYNFEFNYTINGNFNHLINNNNYNINNNYNNNDNVDNVNGDYHNINVQNQTNNINNTNNANNTNTGNADNNYNDNTYTNNTMEQNGGDDEKSNGTPQLPSNENHFHNSSVGHTIGIANSPSDVNFTTFTNYANLKNFGNFTNNNNYNNNNNMMNGSTTHLSTVQCMIDGKMGPLLENSQVTSHNSHTIISQVDHSRTNSNSNNSNLHSHSHSHSNSQMVILDDIDLTNITNNNDNFDPLGAPSNSSIMAIVGQHGNGNGNANGNHHGRQSIGYGVQKSNTMNKNTNTKVSNKAKGKQNTKINNNHDHKFEEKQKEKEKEKQKGNQIEEETVKELETTQQQQKGLSQVGYVETYDVFDASRNNGTDRSDKTFGTIATNTNTNNTSIYGASSCVTEFDTNKTRTSTNTNTNTNTMISNSDLINDEIIEVSHTELMNDINKTLLIENPFAKKQAAIYKAKVAIADELRQLDDEYKVTMKFGGYGQVSFNIPPSSHNSNSIRDLSFHD